MTEDEIREEHKDLHRFLFITCVLSANISEINGLNFQEATERFKLLSQQLLKKNMSTYRFGTHETWDGVKFCSIEKKTLFGWSDQKYWIISKWNGYIKVLNEVVANKLMMESVDRLVKAGHTVI